MNRILSLFGAVGLALLALCTIPATALALDTINSSTHLDYLGAGDPGQGMLTPDSDFAADQIVAVNCLTSGEAVFLSTEPGSGGDSPQGDPPADPPSDPGPGTGSGGGSSSDIIGFYCPK